MEDRSWAWWAQWVVMALALGGIAAMFVLAHTQEQKIRRKNQKELDDALEAITSGLGKRKVSAESVCWLVQKVITVGHLSKISADQLAGFVSVVYRGGLSLERNHWLMIVEYTQSLGEADRAEWKHRFLFTLADRALVHWKTAVMEFRERRE